MHTLHLADLPNNLWFLTMDRKLHNQSEKIIDLRVQSLQVVILAFEVSTHHQPVIMNKGKKIRRYVSK